MSKVLHPYKLWNLWEMLKIFAEDFIDLGQAFQSIPNCFYIAEQNPDTPMTEDELNDLKQGLIRLKHDCDKMRLKVSSAIIAQKLNDLPQNHRELDTIIEIVKQEIQANLFLFVPAYRASHYEWEAPKELTAYFPKASIELIRAGKCYAKGEYTACVFHSMRAAEIGLRSLATYLDVTFQFPIELADWKNIIDQVEKQIKVKQQLPKGASKDEELKYCSQAATHFRYFKDAYRIFVAHARSTYDDEEALSIMEHTIEFLKGLSIKIMEPEP